MNLLFQSIQNLIEKNTNLESSAIQLASEQEYVIQIFINTSTSLNFQPLITKDNGRMKSTIKIIQKIEFDNKLKNLVNTNEIQSSEAVNQWMSKDGELIFSKPESYIFVTDSLVIGYEENCNICYGLGKLDCAVCNKSGKVECIKCVGSGEVTCYGCSGRGTSSCSKCHGSGRNGNTYCSICRGSGIGDCGYCSGLFRGTGRITCNTCGGQKNTTCSSCSGAGVKGCQTCKNTGVISTIGTTGCNVIFKHVIKFESNDKEVNDLVHSLDLENLVKLGNPIFQEFSCFNRIITRNYKLALQISDINIQLKAKNKDNYNIKAYGPSFKVFDYKNLFAKLLDDDTLKLHQCLLSHNVLSKESNTKLLLASNKFLSSEIHQKIADAVVNRKDYSSSGMFGKYSEESFNSVTPMVKSMI